MINIDKSMHTPTAEEALPGRDVKMCIASRHYVNQHPMQAPFPENMQRALFGLGCFWGAEREFWRLEGVYSTAVGYAAGHTPNPDYKEVCSGLTGHNEVVSVIFDPVKISYQNLLERFWEAHNPTQGMQQGNDRGTQYRSGIYVCNAQQKERALNSLQHYQSQLDKVKAGKITTEIRDAVTFYYAEEYHQQYLAKNAHGYCGLGGLGVRY
jgi:peptide-methionine (S)-S-oxide reductase